MPLPHFRIRTLMIAVAVAGISTVGWMEVMRVGRTAQVCRVKALRFLALEQQHRNRAAQLESQLDLLRVRFEMDKEDARNDFDRNALLATEQNIKALQNWVRTSDRTADHYRGLKVKYERAGKHPWQSIPPDPPEPK